jgi:phosphoribosylamine---glycine ligase
MKVLLVGGGGREDALAWKIAQSPCVDNLYAAPGNPGIARHARCVKIPVDAVQDLLDFAQKERVDLTVVGPEAPLVAGLTDRFATEALTVFGPNGRAARLEGSKVYAKRLMAARGIPTARFGAFEDPEKARRFCRELGAPVVVKADGLAAGKGALVCATLDEASRAVAACMERRVFGDAGATVVVEEFLRGEEVSFQVITNGREVFPLPSAQDHKRIFDGDQGPNTGGMGSYSPFVPMGRALETGIITDIVRPILAALSAEGAVYRGVLYVGLMLTAEGPKVVEFNCRFGDPECQSILVRAQGDLVPLLLAAARGEPLPTDINWSGNAAVCVTLASAGYPGMCPTGLPISGVDRAERRPGVRVFHAGTAERDGRLVTAGGRVLNVTAVAPGLEEAISRAYLAVGDIRFDGMQYRMDIGRRADRGNP